MPCSTITEVKVFLQLHLSSNREERYYTEQMITNKVGCVYVPAASVT